MDEFAEEKGDARTVRGPESPLATKLFLLFADLDPTEDAILNFRRRYAVVDEIELVDTPDSGKQAKKVDYSAEFWMEQVSAMHKLTALWLAISEGVTDRLKECITWEKDREGRTAVYFTFDALCGEQRRSSAHRKPDREVIASAKVCPDWLTKFEVDDVLEPAQRYLQAMVDNRIATVVTGKPRLRWHREKGFTYRFVSHDLLGALWVRFAEAIATKKEFRRCDECSTWFEVAPDIARKHRRYCSETCRGKAYRGRQDKARQLHAKKKSFKEIAAELDSDVATVKRWITGFKE